MEGHCAPLSVRVIPKSLPAIRAGGNHGGVSMEVGEAPTHLKFRSLTENLVSMIPVVFTRDRNTSCSLGR